MLTKFCYHSRDGGIATTVSRTFSPLANRDYHNVGSNFSVERRLCLRSTILTSVWHHDFFRGG
jgi:hypothetical protein